MAPVPLEAGLVIFATKSLTHSILVAATLVVGVKVNRELLHNDLGALLSNTGLGLTVTNTEKGLPVQPDVIGTARY